MAKRHKRPGQICPFCGATTTAVFDEPTKRKTGVFKYEKHERPLNAPWSARAGKTCSRSGVSLGIMAWPDWVMRLNEAAIEKLS